MVSDTAITVREIQSGSKRAEYIWVLENDKLVPLRKLGKIKEIVEISKRRKIVKIEIPLEKLIGKTVYIFSFSGKYLYINRKTIKTKEDVENLYKNIEEVEDYKEISQLLLNYYNEKLEYLKEIKEYAKNIQKLIKELGYNSIKLEKGERTREAIMNFDIFICSLLSNPSIQGVAAALKNIYRTLHELFILLTIVKLLKEKYKLVYDSSFSGILEAHTTAGKPYFIFETSKSYIIVTYQFQPIPQEYVTGASFIWPIVTKHVSKELIDKRWKEVLETLGKYKGHIRPDILIFEVKKDDIKPEEVYNTLRYLLYAALLANNEEERKKALILINYIVNKVILIDCKIDFGRKDIEQLEYYKKLYNILFNNKIIKKFYIVSPIKTYISSDVPVGWEVLGDNEVRNIIRILKE